MFTKLWSNLWPVNYSATLNPFSRENEEFHDLLANGNKWIKLRIIRILFLYLVFATWIFSLSLLSGLCTHRPIYPAIHCRWIFRSLGHLTLDYWILAMNRCFWIFWCLAWKKLEGLWLSLWTLLGSMWKLSWLRLCVGFCLEILRYFWKRLISFLSRDLQAIEAGLSWVFWN